MGKKKPAYRGSVLRCGLNCHFTGSVIQVFPAGSVRDLDSFSGLGSLVYTLRCVQRPPGPEPSAYHTEKPHQGVCGEHPGTAGEAYDGRWSWDIRSSPIDSGSLRARSAVTSQPFVSQNSSVRNQIMPVVISHNTRNSSITGSSLNSPTQSPFRLSGASLSFVWSTRSHSQ